MQMQHKTIIVALRMSGAAGRDILSGLFRFAHPGRHWTIRILQHPQHFTHDVVAKFETDGIDGIITSELGDSATACVLASSHIPLVVVGPQDRQLADRKERLAFVGNDEYEVGRQGARHLLSLGNFNAFGYVPARPGIIWSDEREEGFRLFLRERRQQCSSFEPVAPTGTAEDRRALTAWLANLPKPAAVMVAWDFRATQVLNACAEAGIDVPRDLVVLGVDNDELLCDFSTPPLSSILPNHEEAGFVAGRELEALMRAPRRRGDVKIITVPVKKIVDRGSTRRLTPSVNLVNRAKAFIEKNATRGIGVKDVVASLGVSRRLADLRFREIEHRSILEALTERKLETVCRLLAVPDRPLKQIARDCGYTSEKSLQAVFRKRYGMSMREFRQRNS